MIKSLFIKNYAIIDEVLLQFNKGYNVITGETGAGKSILLGALNLIKGARADTKVLYDVDTKCIVEAKITSTESSSEETLKRLDLDHGGDEIIIRREISSSGKSRAFVNDTPVRLNDLKILCTSLIDIHNQFDTLSIVEPDYQLSIVDTVAQNSDIKNRFRELFSEFIEMRSALRRLEQFKSKKSQDLEFIKYQLEELEKVELDNLVKSEIEKEYDTLENSEKIIQVLGDLNLEIHESEHSIISRIQELLRSVRDLSTINSQMTEIYENLQNTVEFLNEVDFISNRLKDKLDVGGERFQELSDLLDHVNKLEKKHDCQDINDLISLRNEYRLSIHQTENVDDLIEDKKRQLESAKQAMNKMGNKLTKSRTEVFAQLSNALQRSLKTLAIPNAKIVLQNASKSEPDESGYDLITFSFSANKGVDPRPVAEVASGGELSRLALSVKSLVADQFNVPTLIFDEIDTGISGAVAKRVGEIFLQISDNHQLICITHSPQVASMAQEHFLVEKRDTEKRTITQVSKLTKQDRISEIAKMLSTDPPTASAVENAKELLEV